MSLMFKDGNVVILGEWNWNMKLMGIERKNWEKMSYYNFVMIKIVKNNRYNKECSISSKMRVYK